MANNATNVWKWTGATSGEWTEHENWKNGAGGAVDDYPDSAADTVTLFSSATNALSVCTGATTVGTITQGTGYAGACCVANLTATTVNVSGASGTITGGTIATLNAGSDCVISGGTITTLNISGTAANNGATVTGVATIDSTAVQYGTWGTDIVCNGNTVFDGNNAFAAGGTNIKPKKRSTTVTFAFGAHTWSGKPVVQYAGAPYSKLWLDGHS
jgi:hypothetical protein